MEDMLLVQTDPLVLTLFKEQLAGWTPQVINVEGKCEANQR